MKSILTSLTIFLMLAFAGSIHAQSNCAVQTQKGRFIIADMKSNPPTNIIMTSELADATTLKVLQDGKLLPNEGSKVKSFTLSIVRTGSKITLSATSELMSPEMVAELKKLQRGDKVYFEAIKAEIREGKIRSMPSLEFIMQ